MLVLFDIDGTLLLSHGASMQSFLQAGMDLFAREFSKDGLSFAGGLDPLIWRALCVANGIPEPEARAHHDRFRSRYASHLRTRLAPPGTAYALPGVPALLSALSAREHLTVGLLTGNYPETGRLKLQAAGLPLQHFRVAAWGDDAEHRRELLPVALARVRAELGREYAGERVVIVGDTPADIDCAAANGCRSLGVATGSHPAHELRACGASRAVDDLSDTESLVAWIES